MPESSPLCCLGHEFRVVLMQIPNMLVDITSWLFESVLDDKHRT
uniref:Uncharacterized protein n=1 Tax=Solanum lycopersicum TaxID=4081 RepID=A0A3Q7I3B1_SOLLC